MAVELWIVLLVGFASFGAGLLVGRRNPGIASAAATVSNAAVTIADHAATLAMPVVKTVVASASPSTSPAPPAPPASPAPLDTGLTR